MSKNKAVYATTRENLIAVKVPESTRTYRTIENEKLIDLTLNSINAAGFKLKSERYTSARDGQICNGRFAISSVSDSEMCLEIGFQNSYNKQISLKYAVGAKILICENGNVHGELGAFKKKHQGTVQEFTPTAITEYIKRAGDVFAQMQKDREQMKKIELTKRVKAEILGRLFADEQIITNTQLGIIAREIEAPTHDYGNPDSLWSMYNYTTFAAKEDHPTLWMDRHIDLHKFFITESGIVVPNAVIDVPTPGSHPQAELFLEPTGAPV